MDSMLASKQNAMQNDAIWELDFDEQLDPKNSHGFPQKELMMFPNVLMSRVIISETNNSTLPVVVIERLDKVRGVLIVGWARSS